MILKMIDAICKPFYKPVQRGQLKVMNKLSEPANFYLSSSFAPLQEYAQRADKDVKIYQKGEDLLLVNIGPRTKAIRPSELANKYNEQRMQKIADGRTVGEAKPSDFRKIVLDATINSK